MTDKTKRKIEAMARKYCLSWPELANKRDFEEGATPWAEWCERFEKVIERGKWTEIKNLQMDFLKWLEDVDG